jgi:hypothetical protein
MKHRFGNHRRNPAFMVLKFALWLALGALVVGGVMVLWNWLMPALFTGARTIGYWQALGLIVLARVLFGRGGGGRHWKARRRWHHMSADEREKFQQYARGGRCGWPHDQDKTSEPAQ